MNNENNGLVVAHLPHTGSGRTTLYADGQIVAFIDGTVNEILTSPEIDRWAIFISPIGTTKEISVFADRFVRNDKCTPSP